MDGRWRSAAGGVKAGCTSLRSRRWSSPFRSSRLPLSRSYSGPESTPWTSSIFRPGKVALVVRRKNVAASRSSTKNPIGAARATQVFSPSSSKASWKRGPASAASV
jgi:hypothetical protein